MITFARLILRSIGQYNLIPEPIQYEVIFYTIGNDGHDQIFWRECLQEIGWRRQPMQL